MDIIKLREKIDGIDDKIKELFLERLNTVREIAEEKKATGRTVSDPERENKIIFRLTEGLSDEYKIFLKELYSSVFATSKSLQSSVMESQSPTAKKLKEVLKGEREEFPVSAQVACQGVMGSNSYSAARKLFKISDVTFFKTFEGVFNAVDKGLCEYGVLPIENSTAGSVDEVYDLMKKYDFYIVKSVRLKINHCLAGVSGAKKEDIKIVSSHPQALRQCEEYVKKQGYLTVSAENTATAARDLAASGDKSKAVLCSEECALSYGLTVIDNGVQDSSANFTRFICICKKLKVFKGSDKISFTTGLDHEPGSLNKTLSKFAAMGLNLTKLESRPVNTSPFEFMFYFDFMGDVSDDKIISLISDLELSTDNFVFLGNYKEIM